MFLGIPYAVFGELLLFALVASMVFAAVGSPFLATICEWSGKVRKKVFLDKNGQHLAFMGMIMGLCTLPFTLAAWIQTWAGEWLLFHFGTDEFSVEALVHELLTPVSLLLVGVYLVALLLLLFYRSNWKAMKKQKGIHILTGAVAALAAGDTLFLGLAAQRAIQKYGSVFFADQSLPTFYSAATTIPVNSEFWPTAGLLFLFSLSAAGAYGLQFILMRRNKDDFGRDYYTYALKNTSKWALFSALPQFVILGWFFMLRVPVAAAADFNNPTVVFLYAAAALLLLAVVCWTFIARSAAPLRLKPLVYLGLFFLVLSLNCEALALMTT